MDPRYHWGFLLSLRLGVRLATSYARLEHNVAHEYSWVTSNQDNNILVTKCERLKALILN